MVRAVIHKYCRYLLSWPRGFSGDRSGVVAVLVALGMPVLVGTMGLAAEASYWYAYQRGMQNAADAAAIAAATNGGSGYAAEATAVAKSYFKDGYKDGAPNITVTAANPATASGCTTPNGSPNACYTVTVSDKVQLFLSQVVGFAGTPGNNGATLITSNAVAKSGPAYPYCILALAPTPPGTDPAIRTNGAPTADLKDCNIMSNTGSTCNGSNLNAKVGDAHGINNGCGNAQNSNQPVVPDPYAYLASNIPSYPPGTCGGSYPQETGKSKTVPPANEWNGAKSLSGNVIVCGDQKLTGNTTIDAPSNAVLVIENGVLDTNGFTFKTTSGSGLTIVFTGDPNNASYKHIPVDDTNSGTLDIAAPTSGPWSGMALYQDPNLTNQGKNLDIDYKGNNPAWKITGMVYLPNSSVNFSGAVNKASNGLSCFGLTVGDLLINGTAEMISNTQCAAAGVTLPTGGHRGVLVN